MNQELSTIMLEMQEAINVWAFFKGNTVSPYVFFWNGRKVQIDSVNLVHTSKEDGATVYIFSVSSQGNFYRLKFNLQKMKWYLEAVEEGS